MVYLKKVKCDGIFLGITVSKKVGNAVERNRVRRIIKAAFVDLLKIHQMNGFRVVIVAKKNCLNVKSYDILRDLKNSIFFLQKSRSLHHK